MVNLQIVHVLQAVEEEDLLGKSFLLSPLLPPLCCHSSSLSSVENKIKDGFKIRSSLLFHWSMLPMISDLVMTCCMIKELRGDDHECYYENRGEGGERGKEDG
jgi:hypothetical protein